MIIRIVQVLFILHQRSTFFKTNYSQNLKIASMTFVDNGFHYVTLLVLYECHIYLRVINM